MKEEIWLGCVADDFTGASDAASFLAQAGVKTILYDGIPDESIFIDDCEAIVVALKSRGMNKTDAVNETIKVLKWLKEKGTKNLYIKYCSTFDSTKEGNIGPVIDAALENFNIPYTLICPSLLANGRSVRHGHIYINDIPLEETHMKDHPLNPMWASKIAILMKEQGKYPCLELGEVEKSIEIENKIELFKKANTHFYIVPDYYEEEQGDEIAKYFGELPLLTGGSGLLLPLGKKYKKDSGTIPTKTYLDSKGKSLILAGSCSKITLEQIKDYKDRGYSTYKIDPLLLLSKEQTLKDIYDKMRASEDILIYSSDSSGQIQKVQVEGVDKIARLLEHTMAQIAEYASVLGYNNIIVAGGETSGAVTKALDYGAFYIGESIANGVPILIPLTNPNVRLVLKSGGFGQKDFFWRSLCKIRGEKASE